MGKNLDAVLTKLNSSYGKGSIDFINKMGDRSIKTVSSGSLAGDIALGGGWGVGVVVEVIGEPSSGKTTYAIHSMIEAQKTGIVAFLDHEFSFDKSYAETLGLNMDKLIFFQPSNGEEGLESAIALAESGEVSMIVIDSVAALVPKSEIEGEVGEASIGKLAKMMSQFMRKIIGIAKKNNCTIMMLQQYRMIIGISFGDNRTEPGGKALKYGASQIVEIAKSGPTVKDGDTAIANTTKIKVTKNKINVPFKVAMTQIEFGKGIVKEFEIVVIGEDLGLLKKSGAWYSYKGTNVAQGQTKAVQFLQDNPEVAKEIELLIRKHYNLPI